MILTLDELLKRGADPGHIRVICSLVAAPALKQLSERYPEIEIYTGTIDAELNEKGYVVPGLGDVGNRIFGT